MNDEFVAELRKVIEEEIVSELQTLAEALLRLSAQLEASHRSIGTKVDAMIQEFKTMREEMQIMREEMKALRQEIDPLPSPSPLVH